MSKKTDMRRSERQSVSDSYATLAGSRASLVNWSREGALLDRYMGSLEVGGTGEIIIRVNYERGFIAFSGHAEVVRKNGKEIAVSWQFESQGRYSDEIKKIINIFFNMRPR